MKNKKLLLLLMVLLGILLFTTACKDKIEETVGNKISEKIIEKSTDENVDIDTKDGLSVETESGSLKSGENLEWPKESMESLPKPKANIISITELKDKNSTSVILNFDKKGAGSDYMQELIDLGYVQISLNKSEDYVSFIGAREEDNTFITFNYSPKETQGGITISRDSDSSKEFFEKENDTENNEESPEVDMSQSMEWPKDAMDNIPKLNAQITSVSLNANSTSIGYQGVSKDDIIDYIEEIKDLGYNINSNEMLMNDFVSYRGADDREYFISISWKNNGGTISYTKQ